MAQPEKLGRRERKRLARKEEILAVALELVVEGGVPSLTIHRLAKQLDYTPGALYRYFSSKGALIAELQCRAVETIHERLTAQHELFNSRLEELKLPERVRCLARVVSLADSYAALVETHPHEMNLISALAGDPRRNGCSSTSTCS